MSEESRANLRAERGLKTFVTATAQETEELGIRLAEGLSVGSVIAMRGELGAGKTVLARGIARGLGIEGYLKSPSFTIINEYKEGRIPFYHIDLYRLAEEGGGSIEDGLALEEYLYGDGVCVIEWAERALSLIPDDAVRITITYGGELSEDGVVEQSAPEEAEEGEEGAGPRTFTVSYNEYNESCHGEG